MKYILIDGKKHYIKDEAGDEKVDEKPDEAGDKKPDDEKVDEKPDEKPDDNTDTDDDKDEDVDDEAKAIAKNIIGKITSELGNNKEIKELNSKVDRLMDLNNPVQGKLAEILNGKDIHKRDQLTKEEKIAGFYYGLMTNNEMAVKSLSEGSDADGGYLVPDEFRAEVIRELADVTICRTLARVVPMKRKTLNYASVVSGPEAYWTAEGATKSTTTVHFGQPQLKARKLAAILYTSDELTDDADQVDVVRLVIELFAERIGQLEDAAFAQGNGTTQPTGLTTAQAAGTITGPTCTGNLDYDDIIDLEYSLGKQYRKKAVYLANTTNIKELRKLKDSNGAYLWQPSQQAGQPATLNGKPFYEFDDLPESQIYFGDFKKGYWWGDRQKISVLLSQHTTVAFTQDKTAIRIVERVAGNVVWGNAIKCLNTIP